MCQLLVILTAHPWNCACTSSQTSSLFPKFQDPHIPVLHLSKAWMKILISTALMSDIRQASDLYSKCCRSKQELRIWDEYGGSLFSVNSEDPEILSDNMSFWHESHPMLSAEMSCCDGTSRQPKKKKKNLVTLDALKDTFQKYFF